MEMEPEVMSQTALDQLVCSEQSQMLKAFDTIYFLPKSAVFLHCMPSLWNSRIQLHCFAEGKMTCRSAV